MKTFLITGIRRIGLYIAENLLQNGYNLGIIYRSEVSERNLKKLQNKFPNKVLGFKADLSQYEEYKEIPRKTFEYFGNLYGFIHIASPFYETPLNNVAPEDLKYFFASIVESAYFLSIESSKFMLLNKTESVKGHIILFGDSAIARQKPYKNFSAYLISKGALHSLRSILAHELAPEILVNEIALGPVIPPNYERPIKKTQRKKTWEDYLKEKTLLERNVSIQQILKTVSLLIESDSITDTTVILDAGLKCSHR